MNEWDIWQIAALLALFAACMTIVNNMDSNKPRQA